MLREGEAYLQEAKFIDEALRIGIVNDHSEHSKSLRHRLFESIFSESVSWSQTLSEYLSCEGVLVKSMQEKVRETLYGWQYLKKEIDKIRQSGL